VALSAKSLFVYGLKVTTLNQNLDFQNVSLGPILTAVVPLGFYSPNGLAQVIATALQSVDSVNTYNVSVIRNIMGGTQNRIQISTNGTFLSLLLGSGPHLTTSLATLIGFNESDYIGATSYIGSQTIGNSFLPAYLGYTYLDTQNMSKVFGSVNVSASGLKEAVTYNIQQFIQVEYKYELKSDLQIWVNFFTWSQSQKPFDFTPEITSPSNYFTCTLEKTTYDAQGLGWQMAEMLPDGLPNHYRTGLLTFRVTPNTSQFTLGG
jgi:hypothetical protein